jgi:phage shock protein A
MKKGAFLFVALAAGTAVLVKYAVQKRKEVSMNFDSTKEWIDSAEQQLKKIDLKLHSMDHNAA